VTRGCWRLALLRVRGGFHRPPRPRPYAKLTLAFILTSSYFV
jgi:hypothetical protein